MFKSIIALFTVCLAFFNSIGQQPDKTLNRWAELNPVEKIYIHFDRNDYIAGQTIWFKGYLYSDFLPDDKSTTLFVELVNASSSVIIRQVLLVFSGYTRGQIELPDTLPGGSYMVRAYTVTMLNHDPDFLYKKTFFIFNRNKKAAAAVVIKPKATRMEFFPEGGNFITGLSNSIAYKATDENGLPVFVSGVVKKENGEKVAEFSSYHDGMGYFDLTAEEKSGYYVVLDSDPSGQKYTLPSQTEKGVVLRIISTGQSKQYEILQRSDNPVFKAAYMIGQMQHHVVFKKLFNEVKDEMTGMIQTANLSSGILHITVFNKDGLPLAERLTFVDNKEYIQRGEIVTDTLNFSDRGSNHFSFILKDTVKGSFSVAVSDPAFDAGSTRHENIFSGLLLTSDIKGYVHNPAYYFSATNDSVQNALDLVMMTNGWRRFSWNDVMKDALPARKYLDPGYITLAGKITLEGTKKPFADKELLTFIVAADSSRNMQMLHTDAEGRFRLDSLLFFDRARILFSDIKGKKSRFIDVKQDGDSLHRLYNIPRITMPDQSLTSGMLSPDYNKRMMEEIDAIAKAQGIMLEGVTVKVRKKTEMEELEEKYVRSGMFSGESNQTIDVANKKDETTGYQNIFDYLAFRVPGLQVVSEDGGYSVFYRQGPTVSSMGPIPMALFLDEILQTDANVIATIPPDQIAIVKVFSSFAGATGGGAGGALAIYMKKGSDYFASLPSASEIINYRGYSVIKEFYSPDYKVDKNSSKSDYRVTLHWDPVVFVSGINPKIPIRFYNNDRTRRFKIVVEGMTTDGKMLMIEKMINPQKAF